MFNSKALIFVSILAILLILSFVLQVQLSKRRSPLPGLFLPLFFTVVAFFFATFTTIYDGNLTPVIFAFILYMIPADIHFVIYAIIRNNQKKQQKDEIDKMHIQDL
ncbi:MAG TPA: hypothetical protein VLS94_06065 [Fusibacter sp.]|nr:hypothetical protein [Fusibacter sp.]